MLADTIRARSQTVIVCASSGVAANSLSGGRTAHCAYGIPAETLTDDSSCRVNKESLHGKALKRAILHIWDEVSMADRYAIEAVNRLLKV